MCRSRFVVITVGVLVLVFGAPMIGAAKKAVRPTKKPVQAGHRLRGHPLKPPASDPATQHYLAGEKAYKAADYATAIVEWGKVREVKPSEHIERVIYLATDALIKQEASRQAYGTRNSNATRYDDYDYESRLPSWGPIWKADAAGRTVMVYEVRRPESQGGSWVRNQAVSDRNERVGGRDIDIDVQASFTWHPAPMVGWRSYQSYQSYRYEVTTPGAGFGFSPSPYVDPLDTANRMFGPTSLYGIAW
jgi:hypothetical protein